MGKPLYREAPGRRKESVLNDMFDCASASENRATATARMPEGQDQKFVADDPVIEVIPYAR